jgi:NADP-dependent 3-hydroxy acid dehydrogenase YdfG
MTTGGALAGAVALVTGAGSRSGAATALRLAREGAGVALVAPRPDRLEDLAAQIVSADGRALVVAEDILDADRAGEAVQQTLDRLGRLDVLVNSAGIMLLATALHATVEDWDRMIALNLEAVLHVTHAAVPYLIDAAVTSPRRVADIVTVSSTAGRVARPSSSVYCLTQFGLNGFTEALRQELLVERVRVGVVQPGTVNTEPVHHRGGAAGDAAKRPTNGTDGLRPEDVADAVAYIVTRECRVAVNEIVLRATDKAG